MELIQSKENTRIGAVCESIREKRGEHSKKQRPISMSVSLFDLTDVGRKLLYIVGCFLLGVTFQKSAIKFIPVRPDVANMY
jgi:hypothetical protein